MCHLPDWVVAKRESEERNSGASLTEVPQERKASAQSPAGGNELDM
jgi:hypothetical protein